MFAFAYKVTLSNTGQVPVQVVARHWHITDANGMAEQVKGLGVVGQQPLIQPGDVFEYTSGCRLRTPSGTMHGSYLCVTDEGVTFQAAIGLFVLEAVNPSAGDRVQPLSARVLH